MNYPPAGVKKTLTKFGYIEISNEHQFSSGNNGFQISPLVQELLVYFGQLECYERCPEILKKIIGIEVGHTQVHRVADTYGKELEKTIAATRTLPPLNSEEVLYAEVDGSMIFTRDEDWKEVKAGRVFKSSDCIDPNGTASWIKHSQYLAYLNNSRYFTNKMDGLIESLGSIKQRLVFIPDGAAWIRNWIEDAFPHAISILYFAQHKNVQLFFYGPHLYCYYLAQLRRTLLRSYLYSAKQLQCRNLSGVQYKTN